MNYEKWMKEAIDNINQKVKTNQNFELKDLFEGCKWEKLTKGERINFGKFFANEVRENNVLGVVRIERAKNNHSKYTKIL